jgi:lipopolysaccharide export system permease protein
MKQRIGGILFRHILREVGLAFIAVLLVLLVLLVTNQLAFILGRIAGGQLAQGLVLELLQLSVLENLGVILPVSLLLGITVALGRLYHDSEMAAAQACGMSPATVHLATGLVTTLATVLAAWLAFEGAPAGARRNFEIRLESQRTALVSGLVPGQFRPLADGAVLYFREQGADGVLKDVFFQRRSATGAGLEIVLAHQARYVLAADGSPQAVILEEGRRYEGQPGQGAWRLMQFVRQTVPVTAPAVKDFGNGPAMQTWQQLRDSTEPRMRGELHWRYSAVLVTLVLGVLAVPLARLGPRKGRYSRVAYGVVLYAVYANLLVWARTLIEKERVPEWLGMWWVHAVAIVLGLALLRLPALWRSAFRQQGAQRRVL